MNNSVLILVVKSALFCRTSACQSLMSGRWFQSAAVVMFYHVGFKYVQKAHFGVNVHVVYSGAGIRLVRIHFDTCIDILNLCWRVTDRTSMRSEETNERQAIKSGIIILCRFVHQKQQRRVSWVNVGHRITLNTGKTSGFFPNHT